MALRPNATKWIFTPLLTDLATDTTLGAAARHEFAGITVQVPESVSRTFRSVKVEIGFRESQSSASNITGWRIGLKLGAAAFSDQDFSSTIAHSSDPVAAKLTADFTAYFAANFGSGTSQTCQVAVAMSTAAARTWRNITAKLIVEYEHDDEDSSVPITEVARTIQIPIQSHHTTLTTSHVEIGTTGGTTNAPANQIPRLSGGSTPWLPTGATVDQIWAEIIGQTEDNTTDYTLYYQIDSATEVALAQIEGGLFGSTWYLAIADLAGLDVTAAHAFKLRSDVTAMFPCVGAILHVTYRFDPADAVSDGAVINSIEIPLKGTESMQGFFPYANTRAELFGFEVEALEPDPITLYQSAVVLQYAHNGGCAFLAGCGLQSARTYTWPTAGSGTVAGTSPVVHRIDHSNGFSMSGRGQITGEIATYLSAGAVATLLGGYLILNYKSGITSVSEFFKHNRTTYWHINSATASSSVREAATADQRTPVIPESQYRIVGAMMRQYVYGLGTQICPIAAEIGAGEFTGDGWRRKLKGPMWSTGDLAHFEQDYDFTDDVNRDPTTATLDPDAGGYRLNIETARVWRRHATGVVIDQCELVVTYHAFSYDVSITGAPAGATVYVVDAVTRRVRGMVEADGAGEGTVTLYDDTGEVIAVSTDDGDAWSSYPGTPGVDELELLLAGGSGDLTAPTITEVSPASGTQLATRDTPVSFKVEDADPGLATVVITVRYVTQPGTFVVHDGDAFLYPFDSAESTRTPTATGFAYVILPRGGWPDDIAALRVYAADEAGNVEGEGGGS